MADIVELLSKRLVFTLIRKMLAEAIAAVHGAGASGNQEEPSVIFVEKRGGDADAPLLAEGVFDKIRRLPFFLLQRDKLSCHGMSEAIFGDFFGKSSGNEARKVGRKVDQFEVVLSKF